MHVCIFIYTYVYIYIYVCVYKYVQTYIMYISCQICLEPTEMYLLRIFAIQSHNNKKLHQLTRTDALSLSLLIGVTTMSKKLLTSLSRVWTQCLTDVPMGFPLRKSTRFRLSYGSVAIPPSKDRLPLRFAAFKSHCVRVPWHLNS